MYAKYLYILKEETYITRLIHLLHLINISFISVYMDTGFLLKWCYVGHGYFSQLSCTTKILKAAWFTQQESIYPQFWKLQVSHQGANTGRKE